MSAVRDAAALLRILEAEVDRRARRREVDALRSPAAQVEAWRAVFGGDWFDVTRVLLVALRDPRVSRALQAAGCRSLRPCKVRAALRHLYLAGVLERSVVDRRVAYRVKVGA